MDAEALLNSLEAGVASIAPGWKITSWSPSAARLTGRPADEVLGVDIWTAFPAMRRSLVEAALGSVLQDGIARTVDVPVRSTEGDGSLLEIEVCRAGKTDLLLLIRPAPPTPHNILPPEGLLGDEGRLYERLFAILPTPALLLTDDGRIIQANAAAGGLLGVQSPAALRDRPLSAWISTNELGRAIDAAANAPQRLSVAIEIPGKDGVREAHLMIAATEPGVPDSHRLCLAVEVSREILLQRRLLQADRLSQLGALVSGVAHELNNPLAAIAAFAEVLKDDRTTPGVAESGKIIHGEAMRAGRIIRTLLDFAKHQPRSLQPVALPDVVDRVLALQRSALKKSQVATSVSFGSQLPSLRGDPRELQQVLLNAVVNARQSIASTGRPGRITISARQSDDHVIVSVEDTGPGVSAEALERVFEPFFSTKGEEGTGLGLSISSGLIRAMGGRMWLQNVEGRGAQLSFELPVDTSEPARDTPVEPRRAIRPLTVLIVEDQVSVRRGMQLMAERLGHHPTPLAGAEEAIAHLRGPSARYDAILVDVHLEDGHTGFEIFQALRAEGEGRERLVVFTTGDSISPQTRDRLEKADRPVLRKPFALDELRDVLDRLA